MHENSERSFWWIALFLSIAIHVTFVLFMPDVTHKSDIKPIMKIRMVMREKKVLPAVPLPKQDLHVEKNVPQPKKAVSHKQPEKKPEPVKAEKKIDEKPVVRQEVPSQAVQYSEETEKAGNTGQQDIPASSAAADGEEQTRQPKSVIEVDTLDVLKKVMPSYSSFSRKRKEQGTVKIIATVTDGKVVNAEIEISSGFKRLDESALRAVRQWLFINSGTVRVRVPITFKLN